MTAAGDVLSPIPERLDEPQAGALEVLAGRAAKALLDAPGAYIPPALLTLLDPYMPIAMPPMRSAIT